MMTKSSSIIKYFLFVFNLTFVLSSIVLMCVGLIIQAEYHRYRNFLDERYFSAPSLLLCLSIIMIVITFFGCCGAIQENYCLITLFSITMTMLFFLEVIGGFAGFALSGKSHDVLTTNLNDTMQLYNKSVEITHVWDTLQENLQCCGINRYSDWYTVLNGSLPMSCCGSQPGAIAIEICNANMTTLHQTPCLDTLTYVIKENSFTIGSVAIGIAFLQLLGIVFSCLLARSVKDNYEPF